MRDLPELTSAV